MPIAEDYTKYVGNRFGKLTVKSFSHKAKHGIAMMIVKCDCGIEKEVRLASLKCGRSNSCGCIKLNTYKEKKLKHGGKGTDLYNVWCSIKQRCLNTSCKDYPNYGGRGILICTDWASDYSKFQLWCNSHGYRKGLSIDRKDNNEGYHPLNCRWVDANIQANNTGRNVVLEFNGIRRTVAQWSRHLGFSDKLIYDRMKKLGWTIEKTLSTPTKR